MDRTRTATAAPFDPSLFGEAIEGGARGDDTDSKPVGEVTLTGEVVAIEPQAVLDLRAHLQVDLVLQRDGGVERSRLRCRGHLHVASGSASTGFTR